VRRSRATSRLSASRSDVVTETVQALDPDIEVVNIL